MIIGVIGAGASGMAAALAAAKNSAAKVLLFERQARVGRKLMATGNGRCNLTNVNLSQTDYFGDDPAFSVEAIKAFDSVKTIEWFRSLGLFTTVEESGRVYPYSDQANSVVDILRFALERSNVQLYTGFEVKDIRYSDAHFFVGGEKETIKCDKLIIACGGLAGTKLGGTSAGYKLFAKLGHQATALRPSLVQIRSSWHGLKSLKGVRANCHAAIYRDDLLMGESTGELQFTDYGLSGPVIFEVSRDVCSVPGLWECRLDFLPEITYAQLMEELKRRKQVNVSIDELLTGILHNRLGRVLTKASGIMDRAELSDASDNELMQVCKCVKDFNISLTEPMGMDAAQVTAGGVITRDFDPASMESKLVPGLYACGEVLDVDGRCGGYNLQWAWSSGYCAGIHAGEVVL